MFSTIEHMAHVPRLMGGVRAESSDEPKIVWFGYKSPTTGYLKIIELGNQLIGASSKELEVNIMYLEYAGMSIICRRGIQHFLYCKLYTVLVSRAS